MEDADKKSKKGDDDDKNDDKKDCLNLLEEVDPSMRCHNVTIIVNTDEIPFDFLWPMLSQDIST